MQYIPEVIRSHHMHRFIDMMSRCYFPTHRAYVWYGARGIKVDTRLQDFDSYIAYVSSLPGFDDHSLSIDRIDNDRNYAPGNVRYASLSEQTSNRRRGASERQLGALEVPAALKRTHAEVVGTWSIPPEPESRTAAGVECKVYACTCVKCGSPWDLHPYAVRDMLFVNKSKLRVPCMVCEMRECGRLDRSLPTWSAMLGLARKVFVGQRINGYVVTSVDRSVKHNGRALLPTECVACGAVRHHLAGSLILGTAGGCPHCHNVAASPQTGDLCSVQPMDEFSGDPVPKVWHISGDQITSESEIGTVQLHRGTCAKCGHTHDFRPADCARLYLPGGDANYPCIGCAKASGDTRLAFSAMLRLVRQVYPGQVYGAWRVVGADKFKVKDQTKINVACVVCGALSSSPIGLLVTHDAPRCLACHNAKQQADALARAASARAEVLP